MLYLFFFIYIYIVCTKKKNFFYILLAIKKKKSVYLSSSSIGGLLTVHGFIFDGICGIFEITFAQSRGTYSHSTDATSAKQERTKEKKNIRQHNIYWCFSDPLISILKNIKQQLWNTSLCLSSYAIFFIVWTWRGIL